MVIAYRNEEDVLQARLDSLLEARGVEITSVGPDLRDVYARRVARVVSGSVASLGGVALLVGGILRYAVDSGNWLNLQRHSSDGVLQALLGGSVLAGALAWSPAKHVASAAFDRALARSPSLSGNVRVDLVRVERAHPRRLASALIGKLEAASAALPLVGLALLAPLGLHLLLWLGFHLFMVFLRGPASVMQHLDQFDHWIAISMPLVGIAHIVLALQGVVFAQKLRQKSTEEILSKPAREGWKALGFTLLAGAIPGGVLLLIPPILVGLTGLVFIPLSFRAVNHAIARERGIVDAIGE